MLRQVAEGAGASLVGTAALALFSKKGRLKTGLQQLRVRDGCDVAVACVPASSGAGDGPGGSETAADGGPGDVFVDSSSAGSGARNGSTIRQLPPQQLAAKARVAARGEAGQLAHLAALYARGDVPRCGWLDALTSAVSMAACCPLPAARRPLRDCLLPASAGGVLATQ